MNRFAAMAVLAVTMLCATAAKADLLIPPCPPGVTPQTSTFPCQIPIPFSQSTDFKVLVVILIVSLLALWGLWRIRRSTDHA